MADEKKDKGAGDPIKILPEEALERQRDAMMGNFSQILQWLPRGNASASNSYSGNATPFKVQVNFEIPIFEGQIDADAIDKWLNLLEGYFSVHDFSNQENTIFAPLKATLHVKDWYETYCEQKVREQDVLEFTNIFHTLHTKLGIKDSKHHLVLKYHNYLHKYIQEEIEFLNISSLGITYRYIIKVEQKFKKKKQDFGSANLKQGKGAPKPQNKGQSQGGEAQENPPKLQAKNSVAKLKKDTGKWCEFHKSSTHNISECRAKQSLVAKLKDSESDACSNSESKPDKGNEKGRQIIDAEPNSTIATMKIHKEEPKYPEEGERLFHSQMWVKGSPLQFIVDSGSQKNLILAEVVKRLGLLTIAHPQPYTIKCLH
eukprot:PITA_16363